jgi:hypothetical protein
MKPDTDNKLLEDERSAFEHWFLTTQCKRNYRRLIKDFDTGLYIDRVVRIAWRAWRVAFQRAIAKTDGDV